MNKILPGLVLLLLCFACNQSNKTEEAPKKSIDYKKYPEALQKVFATHGGLELWEKMQSMSYEIVRPEGNEQQFIQLKDRREKIKTPQFATGYDGTNIWLEADTSYKGNPVFYHNLFFYFYAMPFVLADDGIVYSDAAPLDFEGQSYPGIRISYEAEIGHSPEDEYFIHYDPKSYEMTWLGYTVTFYSKEKSKKIKWIRYNDWKKINNLLLPNAITWYNMEGDSLTTPRNTVDFTKIEVSEKDYEDSFFSKPPSAKIVEQ